MRTHAIASLSSSRPVLVALVAALVAAAGCSSGADADPAPADTTCHPSPPSATDPFAVDRDPTSAEVKLARAIADRYVAEHDPKSLAWDWGEGVLMASMVDLHRVTGEARYRDYYRAWLDQRISRGYSITSSDRCPPADTAIALDVATCEPRYREVVDDVRRYLDEAAPRTSEGGISHMGTVPGFAPQLWVDSLFMFGDFLVRAGEAYGDRRALDTFDEQLGIFAAHMQDPKTGFFTHAYAYPGTQDAGVFWARGNGWVLASAADRLRVAQLRGEGADGVREPFRKLADAVLAAQDPATGLFWTVVNRPGETYLETSATALFAFGLARGYRAGALDDSVLPAVRLALDGLRSRLREDETGRPIVTGVSGPTGVGTFENYARIAVVDDLHFGVGAVVLALLEASGLP